MVTSIISDRESTTLSATADVSCSEAVEVEAIGMREGKASVKVVDGDRTMTS